MKSAYRLLSLLDVKVRDSGSASTVRLVSGMEACEYITLSYCWGGYSETPWSTATQDLESRHAGFSSHALSETLKEAIALTRKLGCNYLWVDAPCIVQDSQSDWEEQSLQMGLFYNHACVTIAATSSTTAKSGIFNSQSFSQARQIPTIIENPNRTATTTKVSSTPFEWEDF